MTLGILLAELDELDKHGFSMEDKVIRVIAIIVEDKTIEYLIGLPKELVSEIDELLNRYRLVGEMHSMSSSGSRDLSPLLDEFLKLRELQ